MLTIYNVTQRPSHQTVFQVEFVHLCCTLFFDNTSQLKHAFCIICKYQIRNKIFS